MDAKTLGQMPANPVQIGLVPDDHGPSWRYGLTKREQMSMAFHAAQIASPHSELQDTGAVERAENAVWEADCLLAELARTQP